MADNKINVWENDPSTGLDFNGGVIIEVDLADNGATSLPTSIDRPAPPAAKYEQGTNEFRYWNLAATLARASSYWSQFLPSDQWQTGPVLKVVMDRGEELQSEYNRAMKAIRFFHEHVSDKTIFTCESPDLVCHEMGHAILDAIKPKLWNVALKEVSAFHEAFADISAILCGLQIPSLRSSVLAETTGKVYRSCRVSKFARQFGWCKRQDEPATVEADCYRNAVNSFFYKDADQLPPSGNVHILTSAPHSLSRVFTGAVFEGLAGMYMLYQQADEAMLLQVSRDMATIIVNGIRAAIISRSFYTEVATNMVHLANAIFPDIAYGQALRSAFIRHGILPLDNAAEFASPLFAGDFNFDSLMENHSTEPEKFVLPISQYGLGVDSIVVQAAAVMNGNNAEKEIASATSYVESLIAKGKLKVDEPETGSMRMKVMRPFKQLDDISYTHELKKEGSEYVLQRLSI